MNSNQKIIAVIVCSGLLLGLLIFIIGTDPEISWKNFYKNITALGLFLSSLGLLSAAIFLAKKSKYS